MITSKPIVVGYDGSDGSIRALDWALDDAARRHLPVTVVHAFSPPLPPVSMGLGYYEPDDASGLETAEATLREAAAHAAEVAPAVPVRTRLVTAAPAVALLDGLGDAEMVVLGSRGLDGFSELLVGSTSLHVATHATCPTVVLPPTDQNVSGPQSGRVVVGVDGSPASEDALSFGFEEAGFRGVGLTAIHCWHSEYFDSPGAKGGPIPHSIEVDVFESDELRALSEALAGWREKFPDVDVRQVVVHSDAAKTLVAASVGAELVVVGSRGRGGFRSMLLGSVSHALLHHAHCPVGVVRGRS